MRMSQLIVHLICCLLYWSVQCHHVPHIQLIARPSQELAVCLIWVLVKYGSCCLLWLDSETDCSKTFSVVWCYCSSVCVHSDHRLWMLYSAVVAAVAVSWVQSQWHRQLLQQTIILVIVVVVVLVVACRCDCLHRYWCLCPSHCSSTDNPLHPCRQYTLSVSDSDFIIIVDRRLKSECYTLNTSKMKQYNTKQCSAMECSANYQANSSDW